MNKEYLFSRKFSGKEYKFYRKTMNTKDGCYSYFEIDTPTTCYGHGDHILFDNGIPYLMYGYCSKWILELCKLALIEKGYEP